MEIIKASLEHLSDLVEMGRDFFEEAAWEIYGVKWEDKDASQALKALIDNNNAIMLIAIEDNRVVGMISALIYPVWYSTSNNMAQELYWYVRPEKRNGIGGKLLEELEARLRERLVIVLMMSKVDILPSLHDFYIKKGYAQAETNYIKRL